MLDFASIEQESLPCCPGNWVHLQSKLKHFCSINQKAWHPFTIYQEELELELKTSINEEDNQNKKIQDLEDINSYLQNANEVSYWNF